MDTLHSWTLLARQDGQQNGGQKLLNLLADPFSSELNSVSFFASLAWTIGGSLLLALAFCFFRPRTNAVYAPRAKHADEKHSPPRLGNGLFSWVSPILHSKEQDLVHMLGLDAVVFLRFLRMLRNIFIIMSILGLAIVLPVTLGGNHLEATAAPSKRQTTASGSSSNYQKITILTKMTPQFSFGSRFWAYTVLAYLFDGLVCAFIWWNYRAILRLRRNYLQSPEYHASLHARTLMITHVPPASRTDEGLIRIAAEVNASSATPTAAIGRNVKDLPELIEDHDEVVLRLEEILAKYLRNPDNLPAKRPTCKPSKRDRKRDSASEVDAINYLTGRIAELEKEIHEVRESIDRRNPMPYGFAAYTRVEDTHAVAYAARSKGPQGTTIKLAPKPSDIIWKNIGMSPRLRRTRSIWNGIWMVLLTVLFIVPNILTAVFLSDFSNLASVWDGFRENLQKNKTFYGILQGILAPLVQSLFYLLLPIMFRRLLSKSGDVTKTSRERHVASKLFGFYIFNQLIVFSLFAAIWRFIALVVQSATTDKDTWEAVKSYHVFGKLVAGLCNTTPYWITWQLQRNLGATVDLAQLWPLIYGSIRRKFGHPTPRENIELSAPPPFDYASYYNAYLFSAAVGFCFATLNPIIIPVTAFYFAIDTWLKKYMLMYICITRVESGGMFWRMAINRLIFGLLLSNVVIALVIGSQGIVVYEGATSANAAMLYALIPLPFLVLGFKWWLTRAFDTRIRYYTTQAVGSGELEFSSSMQDPMDKKTTHRRDRVGVRFGNPVLWRKLKTPMVSAKAQHILPQIYSGRTDANEMAATRAGFLGQADVYMADMAHDEPGKPVKAGAAPFELVGEGEQDFEFFKKRAEFREQFGGEGELYSRPSSRATSLASMSTLMGPGMGGHGRRGSDSPTSSRASSRTRQEEGGAGVTYPKGYVAPMRSESPSRMEYGDVRHGSADISAQGHPAFRADSRERLTNYAGQMGASTPGVYTPYRADSPGGSPAPGRQYRAPESPYTPGFPPAQGYGSGHGSPYDEETSYDYFRRGRTGGR